MKSVICLPRMPRLRAAVGRGIFVCCILVVCLSVATGQGEDALSKADRISVGEDFEWTQHFIFGDDYYISGALTGSVHRVDTNENEHSYAFRLGKLKEQSVIVPAGTEGPKLDYVDEFEIAMKDDIWQANFYKSCGQEVAKASLKIVQSVIECLHLMDQKDSMYKPQRIIFSPAGWNEDNSMLSLEPREVVERQLNVVSWEDESDDDETLVWWTLRMDGESVRFLRIERFPGALQSEQPSYSQFLEYVEDMRELFVRNKLSAEEIKSCADAVEVTICSFGQQSGSVDKRYDDTSATSLSPMVEYDLPKAEMDKLLKIYSTNHPLVRMHIIKGPSISPATGEMP